MHLCAYTKYALMCLHQRGAPMLFWSKPHYCALVMEHQFIYSKKASIHFYQIWALVHLSQQWALVFPYQRGASMTKNNLSCTKSSWMCKIKGCDLINTWLLWSDIITFIFNIPSITSHPCLFMNFLYFTILKWNLVEF